MSGAVPVVYGRMKPRLRWLDDVQADLKIIGFKGWRRKAQDQSECMDVIREPEVKLRGLVLLCAFIAWTENFIHLPAL